MSNIMEIAQRLQDAYPDKIDSFLNFNNPYELLVATILSARVTDVLVNRITPALFQKYPSPKDLADAPLEDIEEMIRSAGFYKNKAKRLKACCQILVEKYNGDVPDDIDELVKLPGVGRKTASVVLADAFKKPAIPVDTHVKRVAHRLGIAPKPDPDVVEKSIASSLPKKLWSDFTHRLSYLGRDKCKSRKPLCHECPLKDLCPSAQD